MQRCGKRKQDRLMMTLALAIIGKGGNGEANNSSFMNTLTSAFTESNKEDDQLPPKKKCCANTTTATKDTSIESKDSSDNEDIYAGTTAGSQTSCRV